MAKPPPRGDSLQKLFFVPDVHVPYHDPRAWGTVLNAIQAYKPDRVVQLGDFLDCYPISRHQKYPGRKTLAQEIKAGRGALLELLQAADKALVDITWGNHEERLRDYLVKQAPELLDPAMGLDIDDLLHTRALGITTTPYKRSLRIGRLHVTHCLESHGMNAVRDARAHYEANVVIGHVHSIQVYYLGNVRGKAKVAASFGWLGDMEKVDYRHLDLARRCWQHGFGTGYLLPNGNVFLQAHPIVDGAACVEGRLIRG